MLMCHHVSIVITLNVTFETLKPLRWRDQSLRRPLGAIDLPLVAVIPRPAQGRVAASTIGERHASDLSF